MAFIEPMHRNKPNITYLLTPHFIICNEISTGANKNQKCIMQYVYVAWYVN